MKNRFTRANTLIRSHSASGIDIYPQIPQTDADDPLDHVVIRKGDALLALGETKPGFLGPWSAFWHLRTRGKIWLRNNWLSDDLFEVVK